MPTGYTAKVADGTVTDLKPFILHCARAMGALVMMRDEPFDAPIPDRFEPSTYDLDQIKEAEDEFNRIENLTEEEVREEIAKELAEFNERRTKALYEHNQKKARYQAMIEKVRAWEGAPEGIKQFALSQLKDSMEFDCREPFRFWATEPCTAPDEWLADKFERLETQIERSKKYHAEEVERTEARNAWIKQLKESLDA